MKHYQFLTIVFIVFSSITISAQIDINSAVQINEHTGLGKSQKTYMKGASSKQGHKALLWLDTRNGFNQLFAQFLDSANNQLGSNFKVNENLSNINTFSYDVAVNESNEFLISWTDENSLYYRFFDKDGKPKSALMSVETEENVYGYEKPAISFLPDGSFVMVMMNDPRYDGPLDGIYIQKFNAAGKPIADKVLIDELDGYTPFKSSDVSVSSDKIIVVYEKEVEYDSDVYFSIFDFNLKLIKDTTLVNNVNEKDQINPAVATFSDNGFII